MIPTLPDSMKLQLLARVKSMLADHAPYLSWERKRSIRVQHFEKQLLVGTTHVTEYRVRRYVCATRLTISSARQGFSDTLGLDGLRLLCEWRRLTKRLGRNGRCCRGFRAFERILQVVVFDVSVEVFCNFRVTDHLALGDSENHR